MTAKEMEMIVKVMETGKIGEGEEKGLGEKSRHKKSKRKTKRVKTKWSMSHLDGNSKMEN